MLVLIGVALVIIGFALRMNPLLVVTIAGIVTALIGGLTPLEILNSFGSGFASSRSVTTFVIVLPIIGLIERLGLQQQAKRLISKLAGLTAGRILAGYLVARQATAALGLLNVGGTPQMVRPLIYPMAEGAAEAKYGELDEKIKDRIKGHAAAADNVGAFFAEDIFVAVGSILLITSFVDSAYHLQLQPLELALWAIPSAIAAFLIHGFRLLRLDGQLNRMVAASRPAGAAAQAGGVQP
ncbi:DUF969 domain-containing protein [Paenarthrobacter sp. Z7-10]|uniref:DUF969 domain-containing protein n=1 Tax=Paenarthrobacter sp. Z7-10 TaxID=2787635 RepID=UPI0022A99CEE|nr:DUF969 domain-containing protein [Paenarthrobacter sp. Z7-10]MCZ2401931.1 DUF969 domain-containing protein [Paenarthrobacter sp. Z7-10]